MTFTLFSIIIFKSGLENLPVFTFTCKMDSLLPYYSNSRNWTSAGPMLWIRVKWEQSNHFASINKFASLIVKTSYVMDRGHPQTMWTVIWTFGFVWKFLSMFITRSDITGKLHCWQPPKCWIFLWTVLIGNLRITELTCCCLCL